MSTRFVILAAVSIVALFLLVAAALVWPQMQPRGFVINSDNSAQSARVRAGNLHDSTPEPEARKPLKPKQEPVVIKPGKVEPPKRPAYDLSKLEQGQVLLRAQVKLTSPGGMDTLAAADHLPCDICLRFVEQGGEPMDNYYAFELDGLVETVCDIDAVPIRDGALANAAWSAYVCWGDAEGFAPIAAPKFEGRVLDFGTLELDLSAALGEQEWLFVGRLMHATGIPIFGLESLSLQIGGTEEQLWFAQHEDGRFACSLWGEFNAEMRIWLVHNYDEDETLQALGKPAVRGRIVDLGDITVNCAAVEAHIDAWPDKQMRLQRHGLDASTQPPEISAWVFLSSINYSTEIGFTEPERVKIGFAMPGPYRWSMDQSDETLAFAEVGGEVMLEAGKLTRIDISFVPVHCVLVRFKAAGPLDDITFEVQRFGAEDEANEWFNSQISPSRQLTAVANPRRQKMKFLAKTRGWAPVELDVAPDTTELTIEFKERAPATTGNLIVELPKLPEFFQDHPIEIGIFAEMTSAGAKKTQQLASYNHGSKFWGLTDEDKLLRFEMPLGATRVWLQEMSPVYGYPRGMISGPVDCTVTADAPCKVKLPAFEAPPWSVAADATLARLTCEGAPMNYQGPVLLDETSQLLSLEYNHYLRLPAGDYAIPEGTLRHALRMTLPTEHQPTLLFEYDFPARLEVRVLRGKSLVPCPITVTATTADGGTTTSATSRENGKLRIWVPQGQARVSVDVVGAQHRVSKAVLVGLDLTIVEIAVEGSYAQFEWDERYQTEEGSYWWLRDAKGELLNTLYAGVKSLKLEPGTYTMSPENAAKPEISIVMVADGDVLVGVPFVPRLACTASFIVKYPKDLKPDPDGYVVEWFWYVPVSGDTEKDIRNREYASEYGWMRCTVDGIKFGDMPVNQEIVFLLAVGALDDEGNLAPQAWAVSPMRLTLKGGEMETIAVEWKRAVVLNHDWYDWGDVHWIGPDNAGMRYTQYNRILLPGGYSATLYSGEAPKVFPVALKLETDKFFEMPPEIRKALNGEESSNEEGGD